jgi:hypothetical protein
VRLIHYLTNPAVCLTTGPQPLPKRFLQSVRSSASSINFQHLFPCLKSFSSCLLPLLRLSFTYVLSRIFPSVTCFRRQFQHKIWPIQLAFLLFTVYSILLSPLTLCNTLLLLTRSVHLILYVLLQHLLVSWLKFSVHLSSRSPFFYHPETIISDRV